jgi:hypothetical protein
MSMWKIAAVATRRRVVVPLSVLAAAALAAGVCAAPAYATTPLTVTVFGAQNYGSSTIGWAGTTSVAGVTVTGMSCTTVNPGTLISPTLPAGGYTLTGASCSGGTLSNPNYTIGSYTGSTFTVYRVPLTATATNKSKLYGTANPALTYGITGFVNGETSSVVTGSPNLSTTATTSSNVGTYPITLALGTLNAPNYYFVAANGTLTVNPVPVTVTVTGAQVFGTTSIGWSATTPGLGVSGVSCTTVDGGTAIGATLAAGAHSIDGSSCSGGVLSSSNYTIGSYNGSTFTVYRAALTVTAEPKSRLYGVANPALTYTITGFANGDDASVVSGAPALSTTATASSNVGSYPITVSTGTLSAANYYFVFVSSTLTVNPVPVTVTVTGAQVYGTTNVGWSATTPGLGVSGVSCTTVDGGTAIGATLAAGAHSIDGSSCSGGVLSSSNYTIAGYTGSTFTVYRSALTVTAEPKSRVYGAANPAFTYTITGFVNGDDPSVVTGSPTLSTTATPSSNVGGYPITVTAGTLSAANYYFVFVSSTLTVNPAPLTVTVNGAQNYGSSSVGWAGKTSVAGVTVSGMSCTAVNSGAAAVDPTLPAGSYTLDGSSCSGGVLSSTNYTINSYIGGAFTVYRAPLTVTADPKSRIYGAANPAFTYTITGFLLSDDASVVTGSPTLSTTATPSSNIGTYPITVAVGTLHAANYYFVGAAGTLTVTPAPITVTVRGAQNYGSSATGWAGTTPVNGLTVSGMSCTTVNGGTAISSALNAGTYTVDGASCSGGVLSSPNYSIGSYTGSTYTVYKVGLTVTADSTSRVYGAANPSFTYSITGFVNGDDASVVSGSPTLSTPATTSSGIGGYPITAAVGTLSAANYGFVFAGGTLTITRATLDVTAADKSRPFGEANPALTYSITGFVAGDTASVVSGTPTLSTTATVASDPGTFPITVGSGSLAASNYTFALHNGTLTVTQATPSIATSTKLVSPITATLTYGSGNTPIVGVSVVFTMGQTSTVLCTSTTNASGVASCNTPLNQVVNVITYGYTATFAGTTDFAAVSNWQKG